MVARLSPYVNFDAMDNPSLAACERWVARIKPKYLQCFAAARWNESRGLIERMRRASPDSTIIWRGYAHDSLADEAFYARQHEQGISPVQAAYNWYQYRVKPFRDFIHEHKIVIMLLNEAAPVFNAPFETECIRLLGEDGVRVAAMAWATGTPDVPEYQHPAILECVRMMHRYNTILNRHEYCNPDPALHNDLVNRYRREWGLFEQMGFLTPETVIGEFGAVKAWLSNGVIQLDADAGWRSLGISEEQYADLLLGLDAAWYRPNGVCWNLYQWGGMGRWVLFNTDNAPILLERLADASQPGGQLHMAENGTWQYGKVTATAGVRLRKAAISGEIELTLPYEAEVLWKPSTVDGWHQVHYTDKAGVIHQGFASSVYIQPVTYPPPPPPPVEPPPLPPPPEDWRVKLSAAEAAELFASLAQAAITNTAAHNLIGHVAGVQQHIQAVLEATLTELYAAYVLLRKAGADTGQIEERLALLETLKQKLSTNGIAVVEEIVARAKQDVIAPK